MYAYMRFGQNDHPADTTAGGEVVQVDVQQGRPGCRHTITQRLLHESQVVQVVGAPQVQDNMFSRIDSAIFLYEMVLAALTTGSGLMTWPDDPGRLARLNSFALSFEIQAILQLPLLIDTVPRWQRGANISYYMRCPVRHP